MADEQGKKKFTAEEQEMLDGYIAMAADVTREAEAIEWCEGLIGDCLTGAAYEEYKCPGSKMPS